MNPIDGYNLYLKIIEHSIASNGRITLALRDDYRQSGDVKSINLSFSEDGKTIEGVITFFDMPKYIEYKFSEIVDVYS